MDDRDFVVARPSGLITGKYGVSVAARVSGQPITRLRPNSFKTFASPLQYSSSSPAGPLVSRIRRSASTNFCAIVTFRKGGILKLFIGGAAKTLYAKARCFSYR